MNHFKVVQTRVEILPKTTREQAIYSAMVRSLQNLERISFNFEGDEYLIDPGALINAIRPLPKSGELPAKPEEKKNNKPPKDKKTS